MIVFEPPAAHCRVFTYREGLLSGLGHDLEFAVARFRIEVDPDARTVSATFDPTSLRVEGALRDGTPLPDALSPSDRSTIESNTRDDVLDARRYGEIRFRSTRAVPSPETAPTTVTVDGTLDLHGAQRPVTVELHRRDDTWQAEVVLQQPDFGIRPYSALLGALKVKAEVRVRLTVPHPARGSHG